MHERGGNMKKIKDTPMSDLLKLHDLLPRDTIVEKVLSAKCRKDCVKNRP